MPQFEVPVAEYMTREVEAVPPTATLAGVARALERLNISAVPVVDRGVLVGVVSRSDLLHAGRTHAAHGRRGTSLEVPAQRVAEIMKPAPFVVTPATPLTDAARSMLRNRIHRVFVIERGHVAGVLSTLDLTVAVRDARVDGPLRTLMSAPIFSVDTQDPLALAIERLELAHVTALVVVEDGWPVGVFTQVEALAARDLPRDTPVEDVFDQALVCLPAATRIYRAAALAARLDVRRVVVADGPEVVGIVSGLDFARVVAGTG